MGLGQEVLSGEYWSVGGPPGPAGTLSTTVAVAPTFLGIKQILTATKIGVDFASVASGATGSTSTTVTVTGAAIGDMAQACLSISQALVAVSAYVSAADTVTVLVMNAATAAVDLGSATVRVIVWDLT